MARAQTLRRASELQLQHNGRRRAGDTDHPTAWTRIFLAGGHCGEVAAAGARATNTAARSCGTGKNERRDRPQQQRFTLFPGLGFLGAGGHTVAGGNALAADVGVTQPAASPPSGRAVVVSLAPPLTRIGGSAANSDDSSSSSSSPIGAS
ncbi:hypothetical protein E2562_032556 [Oryza meyeriana var. granulata]|uniref:Uncharacterized protein n=1 Tax=Oryza meyeriana var. granulata TaxID=110450 RepID=A0A6G1CVL0_9ORYZ|nr:hypothetical protein E2562_032556 [Oryza meyeriana var. granulata]